MTSYWWDRQAAPNDRLWVVYVIPRKPRWWEKLFKPRRPKPLGPEWKDLGWTYEEDPIG